MEPQTADRTKSPSTPGPLASFVRFVVCGGGIGVLSSFAVPLVAMTMPWAVANAVITVASTLLCTELHALFTFGTGRRPGWRRRPPVLRLGGRRVRRHLRRDDPPAHRPVLAGPAHGTGGLPERLGPRSASAASWSCACSSSPAPTRPGARPGP